MQNRGLWREKVEKRAKIPELRGFYPQWLWKTGWKMWKKTVDAVDCAVNSELNIQTGVCIRILMEL